MLKWIYCGESGERKLPEDSEIKAVVLLLPTGNPNSYYAYIQLAYRVNNKWYWQREVDDEVEVDDSQIPLWFPLPCPFPKY